ncbi:MAG: hypothetical protein AAFY90_13015 [Pseudomonadota bacterium]
MIRAAALIALATLAGCGANGATEPVRNETGLSASASIGVGGSF